jgi:hypothetical protein
MPSAPDSFDYVSNTEQTQGFVLGTLGNVVHCERSNVQLAADTRLNVNTDACSRCESERQQIDIHESADCSSGIRTG